MPVGDGDRTVDEETIDLVYPDGQRDAEALLVHPVTGRLYVATKGFFGGELYAAPPELADDAPNTLGLVGETTGIVTDGAFFPDGEHLILRTYTNAVVYAFPSLEQVGAFDLPSQEQGEGIAAPSDKVVYLSSEGQQAPVLKVPLPPEIRAALSPTPTASASVDAVHRRPRPSLNPRAVRPPWTTWRPLRPIAACGGGSSAGCSPSASWSCCCEPSSRTDPQLTRCSTADAATRVRRGVTTRG